MNLSNLFTEAQQELLFSNGQRDNRHKNHAPVAYLQIRRLGYAFLITELDEKRPHYAYGLADYNGNVYFDTLNLQQLTKAAEEAGDVLQRNLHFSPKYNVAVYAKVATSFGAIVFEDYGENMKRMYQNFNRGRNCELEQNVGKLKNRLVW